MATLKENLIAAKALIDKPKKWVKGAFHQGECRCAVGAIGDILDEEGRMPALNAVRACLPEGFSALMDFNDAPGTTHADIMALFDRAIAAQDGA